MSIQLQFQYLFCYVYIHYAKIIVKLLETKYKHKKIEISITQDIISLGSSFTRYS